MSDGGDEQMFERLLHTAERAALAGKTEAALAVLRAVTKQYPHELRGWRALAELSDDDGERRVALEQVYAISPQRTRPLTVEVERDDFAQAEALDFEEDEALDERQRGRVAPWVLYALALVVLLAVAIPLFRLWRSGRDAEQPGTSTMVTCADCTAVPTTANDVLATAGLPTVAVPLAPTLTPTPSPQPTTALPPTPQPTLAPGAVVQSGAWSASLLRPDYSLFLDGALGGQQPRGRFLLVLLSLANGGGAPQPFPPEMLVLHDAQGRTYTPLPGLSTLYLTTYGRGQRGDLSLENALPAGGGLYSVPVIYDVPVDASGLQLSLGDTSGGAWPVGP
jgi:hypothetical protein